MPNFRNIHFSHVEDGDPAAQARLKTLSRTTLPEFEALATEATEPIQQYRRKLAESGDEAVGRLYLQTFLEDAGNETLLEITSPERAELVPDMVLTSASSVPGLTANNVVFQQSAQDIPIFGGRVVVDVSSDDKSLVAINGKVSTLPRGVSSHATISASDAFGRLGQWGNQDKDWIESVRETSKPPILTWFLDEETEVWHLVYHFPAIPMRPLDDAPSVDTSFLEVASHCLGCSPRSESATYDYFVDAHDGAVVFFFSSNPHLDIPAPMRGIDSNGSNRSFFGLNGGTHYLLRDPLRNIETFDYANGDLDAVPAPPLPANAIQHASHDLANAFPAAVSAHANAITVYDFFNDVLKRNGVDGKGMKLVSVVNVYSSRQNNLTAPQWANAVWWQKKMWYGQVNGSSYAKHLDVIAHELTHGVTESSSNLIYRRLSGALNESYSDIFGIIIANWYPQAPNPLSGWKWLIGDGIGQAGGPIRNFADPASTGQPDHFSKYKVLPLSRDEGGVHIYSGIHNKAIYHLLTAKDAAGNPAFPIPEIALLLYLTLTRLTPTSDFHDSRRTLESVIRTYHGNDPARLSTCLQAVASAFGAVGL